jgi:hypothetical protein
VFSFGLYWFRFYVCLLHPQSFILIARSLSRPTQLNYTITRPNRLTIAMLISVASEAQGLYTEYIKSDISTCVISFNHKLGNVAFEV